MFNPSGGQMPDTDPLPTWRCPTDLSAVPLDCPVAVSSPLCTKYRALRRAMSLLYARP